MGSIWGRQDRGGPHVGPMNFAIWVNNIVADDLAALAATASAVIRIALVLPGHIGFITSKVNHWPKILYASHIMQLEKFVYWRPLPWWRITRHFVHIFSHIVMDLAIGVFLFCQVFLLCADSLRCVILLLTTESGLSSFVFPPNDLLNGEIQ